MSTSSAHLPPARDNLEVSPPGVVAKEAKLKPVSQPPQDNVRSEFGPNEWLVDEMYERFLEDPDSVDGPWQELFKDCLLYTSDAADDLPCVDLGGRRFV